MSGPPGRAPSRDFEQLWQHAPSGQLLLSDDGLVTAVNATFATWTGHDPAALVGTPFTQLLPVGDRVLYTTRCVPQLMGSGRVSEASVQVRGADGVRHPVLLSATRVLTDAGPEVQVVLVDAQQRRRYEQDLLAARRSAEETAARVAEAEAGLKALVHHDALTGLLNRAGMLQALHTRLARTAPPADGTVPTVFFLDLDGFKTVNDDLGHACGDELLQVLAGRIRAAARSGAVVARFAGDEFVVLDDVAPGTAPQLAERLLAALVDPVELRGVEVVIAASLGLAAAEPPADAPADVELAAGLLLRRADAAMYRAKAQGSGRWAVHVPGSTDPETHRLELLEQLRAALRDGELRVHYQPRVDAASGTVLGVEALVRWQHPTRGLLPPAAFVDAAERSGLIRELGAWVLQEAVEQAVRWSGEPGGAGLHVSVNLSARQLAEPGLADRVAAVLARAGLKASRLVLEITETALMASPETALRTLQQLRAIGVQVAVDDFGTGYSSFTYLTQFPVGELKIDRSFVAGMTTGEGDRAIVATCVHLAHAMGMIAVAEGVETAGQRDALVALGCDQLQGWFFGRAVPADDLDLTHPLPR